MVEEQINQSVRVQTEFEEWVEGGEKLLVKLHVAKIKM